MKLRLRYNPQATIPIAAAYLRGSKPHLWLQEIDGWNIDPKELTSFIVPQSLQSLHPAGLLVIFKENTKITHLSLLEPFSCIGGKLFIPTGTTLYPEITDSELNRLLIWDIQILHPVFGFVGFEKHDATMLADLFSFDQQLHTDWSFAHPGSEPRPPLRQIIVEQPGREKLMASLAEGINQKALEDIPIRPEDKQTMIGKQLNGIKRGLYWILLKMISVFDNLFPPVVTSSLNKPAQRGFIQKIQQWLEVNLTELEQKRANEIQRLLKLFDEDQDEALEYAIPLNSPYLDRGTSRPSDRLTRNPLKFNLGKLGGGYAVDGWDLGNRYNDLRAKYLRAAQREIAEKDFKKAAYVYAHLLGDYHSAANMLEKGKFYREAATLYRDHLKNISSAAECLERGGLLQEAITLYEELNRHEKIGDLYQQLQQQTEAVQYYEKHIDLKYNNRDYLDAARVIQDKLHQEERAKEVLLKGWTDDTYQAEQCLNGFFTLVKRQDINGTERKIKEVYYQHTAGHKRISFLNILERLYKSDKNDLYTSATRDIAYEIVYRETEQGNSALLNSLRKFLPKDPIISSDASRYIKQLKNKRSAARKVSVIQLDPTIHWIKGSWHGNQFIVLGLKNGHLQLARVNWHSSIEYHSWIKKFPDLPRLHIINAPYFSNYIIVDTSEGIPISRKNLPRNKYFNESLIVSCPFWLYQNQIMCVINEYNTLCRLETRNGSMCIQEYTLDGTSKEFIPCILEDGRAWMGTVITHMNLQYHKGCYYTYEDHSIFSISNMGKTYVYTLQIPVQAISVSPPHAEFYMVASTNLGLILLTSKDGNLESTGIMFADVSNPSLIVFISANRFITAEDSEAILFEIGDADAEITKVNEYKVSARIIDIFPGSTRNQFALVDESGKITFCSVG